MEKSLCSIFSELGRISLTAIFGRLSDHPMLIGEVFGSEHFGGLPLFQETAAKNSVFGIAVVAIINSSEQKIVKFKILNEGC